MRTVEKVKETVTREKTLSFTCDVCGREDDDDMEMQEYHIIYFSGGYNSIFGDEAMVEAEICQHCLKEKLGEYLRVGGDWTHGA